ncbi:nucleotide exchange factor GrpE [Halorubrum ezzemoulense]|uniref:Protein GrpE n=1 Tax=Halorubrum ezzemoulense TaxID=337243 RepID=A0A256JYZ7_HALEZ|nr:MULTISPECIES: nucleotide exchange factor GrpE [Halorubrum]MDB2241773.1 nucleotide exchange factor GrpE [Halorubrum ezzemoulense]MDB2262667.1 nucleotide exchange factor GrpE [Halorubrum ezzemoulense]MDB2270778.1 nucleotide exchange factor GrpE [Halorubrum ezzemoulense]MDB2281753.1 nucleotide exchange factor GrpE [Halorubrum ezzemoulense]MDB9232763.1 nucleotide exchange factor GrpE [Halorubrum ezzemoulense]
MSDDDAVDVESADDEGDAARANGTAEATADGASGESAAGDDGGARAESEALAAAVAEHDEALAREVAALEADLAETREALRERDEEVEELTSKLARVKADFSNYKERAKRKQEDIRERASEALVERLTPVRNDLLRALDQDEGSDLRPGVESTLEKFDDVLAEEGVEAIDPEPGEEVDPARHQVMLRVDSERPEGTVHEVYEPGYEMGDRVLSEAKVTVSTGDGE